VFTDVSYLDFSSEESAVKSNNFGGTQVSSSANVSTDWQFMATVTGPGGGQRFPRAGSISQGEDLWDASFSSIGPARGLVHLRGLFIGPVVLAVTYKLLQVWGGEQEPAPASARTPIRPTEAGESSERKN